MLRDAFGVAAPGILTAVRVFICWGGSSMEESAFSFARRPKSISRWYLVSGPPGAGDDGTAAGLAAVAAAALEGVDTLDAEFLFTMCLA